VRSEKIYIGRLDVVTMKLDGTKRVMQNEADFAQRLRGLGFSVVEAAEYTEEEKAYILETAKVVVLPVGAG
jgi:capsular polysaccharide biosynthesis protein